MKTLTCDKYPLGSIGPHPYNVLLFFHRRLRVKIARKQVIQLSLFTLNYSETGRQL